MNRLEKLDKSIKSCDKDSPIEGQIDILGNTHHKNKKKTYRVDLNEKGSNYSTWLEGYSENQIRGYIKSHYPKAKINSIRED